MISSKENKVIYPESRIICFVLTLMLFSYGVSAAQLAKLKVFTPVKIWTDDKGLHINAHGGGITTYKRVYYGNELTFTTTSTGNSIFNFMSRYVIGAAIAIYDVEITKDAGDKIT
ncbi:hypothetical protein [Pedobacter alpinus]|uniref:Uncharacterized protein n=1 Tax=Pedobacter alpinus TaxID=1590643 RepID=A0ABW5TRA4_9SPHI